MSQDMEPPVDPMQENRRLRASMERMRSNQRLARSGVLIAMFAGMAFFQVRDLFKDNALLMVGVLLSAVSGIIIVLTALPFLRSPCPKCKRSYHGPAALLRSAEQPAPCRHCGFQINQHVSRYS
ncbi:hypothetical protein VC279_21685 [Xanthomonas sp. WHRI 10064A]|uniref:hypothetical protein n=1 Tax=unclassified Xanthomonas TaxID=2643310 RepID=UPI002B23D621|nr:MULTISPECIES: hypothetical protein [unclassified Xanthomonas]MEA9586637.1 hypothetical protein [Xanthomonas sp. WHRI 10064B]MEA9617210.1 hypothetical protein [Xanthomonas sp. WHRI 10064A]